MKLSSFFKQPHCIEMTNRLFLKQEVAEMANEDKKDFNAMLHDNKDMPICQNFKSLQTRKVLKNMVAVKCILHRQSTMTK